MEKTSYEFVAKMLDCKTKKTEDDSKLNDDDQLKESILQNRN